MRSVALTLLVLAGILAASAQATQPPIIYQEIGSAPDVGEQATSRAATLTVKVASYPLVCGRATGSLAVGLPAAVQPAQTIAPAEVRLNGRTAARVAVSGRQVTVTAAAPAGVTCHSIMLDTLTLVFARAATVSGSTKSYPVTVRRGGRTFRATLRISA